jgi:hypothetical protein
LIALFRDGPGNNSEGGNGEQTNGSDGNELFHGFSPW